MEKNNFEIIYLLGQDNLNLNKQNEFIIYQGSHGDKGAEIADVILPGAAYTEQNGFYTNLEGKLQKAHKASYPPGDAKEDWVIFNELAEIFHNKKLFNNKEDLDNSMFNQINLYLEKNESKNFVEINDLNFNKENLLINNLDYYYSNVIARASKTMFECRDAKANLQLTATEA